jgi:histidyl-tRNA synthetase
LISDLGGAAVPGTGFAIGEDRLVEVLPHGFRDHVLERRSVAVLPVGGEASAPAIALARDLVRSGAPVEIEVTGRSLKASLKWASKIGASVAVIIGEQELAKGVAVVRDLDRGEQQTVALGDVVATVVGLVGGEG